MYNNMNCIIIDDEPLAREILETYIKQIPFVTLCASCSNAYEASEAMQTNQIDLLFLDIQMPGINGLSFAQTLTQKPLIIFTTAYAEYALQGFEVQAVDYLLKPISPERFLQAVTKAHELFILHQQPHTIPSTEFMFVKSEYQTIKINFADITYIEGLKDYVKIYCGKKMIVTLLNIKNVYEKLPKHLFIRVHKSYIVSVGAIEKIDRQRIIIGNTYIPIGEMYKEDFERKMGLL